MELRSIENVVGELDFSVEEVETTVLPQDCDMLFKC